MTVSSVSPVVAGCNGSESNGIMMFMFSVEYLVGKLNNDSYYYTHTLQQLLTLGEHSRGLQYSFCLSVCVFSLFWHLAQSGVQTAVSATSARYGHEI